MNHPIWKIIAKNTFTLFNFVNLILAIMVASVGSFKNMLFVTIALANTLISIINEIRAKKIVDKLRLISEQRPTVIRNGKSYQITKEEIKKGDRVILSLGDQIMFDSVVKNGTIEVNESFISGEQDNIEKHPGDQLTSGSFVVSGTAEAEVEHIGADNFVTKLTKEATTIKTADSKLFKLMNNIVKYISYTLIPIGALLLWARFRTEPNTTDAVTSTVAALINMIPEGLILLTSTVLALATIRLGKKKVLVQDLYSIETLARVDCICLDKTGTLTTGKMAVHDYTACEKSFERALTSILTHQTSENATISALRKKFLRSAKNDEIEGITEVISFSSDRKYSGIKTKKATYLLGAIEFITDDQTIIKKLKSASGSYRTLAVVKLDAENGSLLGYIRLEDEIRPTASKIIKYFYDNDIKVKIISGDDLEAVTSIAKSVGVKDLKGIDLSSISHKNYAKLAEEYSIFTRVTPSEKKELIKAFKKQGSTVAMTGDGVNDILAMKEADVVLLNSDFDSVPSIIDEGRQSINNLERSTALFLAKTVYASILAVLFVILPLSYPFTPIEMSLLNFACIGFPGFILALEKNTTRIKNRFTKNIVEYSLPIGLTVSICMLVLSIIAHNLNLSRPELTTMSVFITFAIDLTLIYWISRPLNKLRTALIFAIIIIVAGAFLIPFTHNFFEFIYLSQNNLVIAFAIIAGGLLFFNLLRFVLNRSLPRLLKKLHI